MRVDVDMSELADLGKTLGESAAQAMTAVHSATLAEGKQVHARAKAGAPRDRPWLVTGIRRKTRREANGSSVNVYTIPDPRGRTVAFYVEYGTATTAPQPFMQPAVAPALETYPAAIAKVVDPFGGKSTGAASDSGDE
jgi:HK97 gp10 family phage protein